MKNKTICFTGHRIIPHEELPKISKQLKDTLIQLIENGYQYFCAGGALGFDTLAEQAVLELKKDNPQIRLILVLPCLSQANSRSESDKHMYEYLKTQADKIVYTSQAYTRGCMHKRNRYLADNSSTCVCYLTKQSGGTAYTVNYALKNGKRVINIADMV